jgi:hypothetical protein
MAGSLKIFPRLPMVCNAAFEIDEVKFNSQQ